MIRDNAKVSVFDSGFLLGDGIWEGLRLHKKKWVFFEDHIERLFEALKLVEIKFEISKDQINIKGKTTEKLGVIGKEKAIATEVIVSVVKYDQ